MIAVLFSMKDPHLQGDSTREMKLALLCEASVMDGQPLSSQPALDLEYGAVGMPARQGGEPSYEGLKPWRIRCHRLREIPSTFTQFSFLTQ